MTAVTGRPKPVTAVTSNARKALNGYMLSRDGSSHETAATRFGEHAVRRAGDRPAAAQAAPRSWSTGAPVARTGPPG